VTTEQRKSDPAALMAAIQSNPNPTQEDYFQLIEAIYSPEIAPIIQGLFRCDVGRGHSLADAFKHTIRLYLEQIEQNSVKQNFPANQSFQIQGNQ
jgi:hypothetical protein